MDIDFEIDFTEDVKVVDTVFADAIEPGDQIVVEGDHIEVKVVDTDREDPDEVLVKGYSHDSGDAVEYPLYADDTFDVWSI